VSYKQAIFSSTLFKVQVDVESASRLASPHFTQLLQLPRYMMNLGLLIASEGVKSDPLRVVI
jgi:hypothetical protein